MRKSLVEQLEMIKDLKEINKKDMSDIINWFILDDFESDTLEEVKDDIENDRLLLPVGEGEGIFWEFKPFPETDIYSYDVGGFKYLSTSVESIKNLELIMDNISLSIKQKGGMFYMSCKIDDKPLDRYGEILKLFWDEL